MATRLHTLVARGNTSDVFFWGSDSVIKVLRPGIPDEWAAREARTTQLMHAAGLPAPAVRDITTLEGRPAIVLERARGMPMWQHMLANPADIPRLAMLLADLQAEINATPAPAGLPRLADRLRQNISNAALLSPDERKSARQEVAHLTVGTGICHFDVHPNNVLMDTKGPMIVDWFDAAAGNPAADIVRSSVLMRRDAADCHLPCPDASLIDVVHHRYLAAVMHSGRVDAADLLAWEGPVVAARLAEPLNGDMRSAMLDGWRAGDSSRPTPLGTALQMMASSDRP